MIRGLAVTGAVTSAGIVPAGTFSVPAMPPLLVSLTQVGFLVAFGVLLDTSIVRSILLPATVMELERRVWWPSRLSHAEPAEKA